MRLEAETWLVRRDHDGDLDVLRIPNGSSQAWELPETEADDLIAYVNAIIARPANPTGS